MAVPSSGALSMLGIRRELSANNYNSSNSYASLSLYAMSTGIVSTINTANLASDRPNGSAPHSMSEFYSYDHDKTSTLVSGTITVGVDNIYSSYFYGYSSLSFPNMGSASVGLVVSSFGAITAMYWQNSNYLRIYFYSTPPTWSNLVINGISFGASSGFSTSGNQKYKYTTTNPFGTSSGSFRFVVFS